MKDIGIGLAGTGLGALVLRVNQDPDSRLHVLAMYEPDRTRSHQRYDVGKSLAALQSEFGVAQVVDSYDALLAVRGVDVIAVFSPCPLHFEQVRAALLAHKHVVVTKPLCVSLAEARELVDLVDRMGVRLLVAQSMRWNSLFRTIHDLFTEGALGEVRLAESYYVHDLRPVFDKSPWRCDMPQDLMYGGVCHPVDLLRWFLGEAEEAFAYGNRGGVDRRYPPDIPMNYVISLRYRSGAMARILGGFDLIHPPSLWGRPFHGVGIGLYGTKASLFNDRIVREYYPNGTPKEEKVEPREAAVDHRGEVLQALRHFEACITQGTTPLVDVRDGAQVVAVCHACWESIRSGRPAPVPSIP